MAKRLLVGKHWFTQSGCVDGGCDDANCVQPLPGTWRSAFLRAARLARAVGEWVGGWFEAVAMEGALEAAEAARVPEWACCSRGHLRAPVCPSCGRCAPSRRCGGVAAGPVEVVCEMPAGHAGPHRGKTYYREVAW